MAEKQKPDYLVDISAGHRYRNQSREYQRLYYKWRTDPANRYGYSFVYDKRLRTYVDGEGYLTETPVQNERKALRNCCRLTCMTLLIMTVFTVVKIIVMQLVFGISDGARTYYSEFSSGFTGYRDGAVYALMTLNLLEYIMPLIFLKATTRMPTKIAVPLKKSRKGSTVSAVTMMLVIMVIGRIFNSFTAFVLQKLKIDIPYYDYIEAASPLAQVISSLVQHVVIAILIEMIFRGYLLQLFRQFGDTFAVIVTSIAGCLMLFDLTQVPYMFCVGVFSGVVTIRSGSIKDTCIMRVSARSINFLVTLAAGYIGGFTGRFIQLCFCTAVMVGAIFVYIRINNNRRWSFEIGRSDTALGMGEKLRTLFVSPAFWIWVLMAFAVSIWTVRLL
ncbi:MAG: CPBP family intramembrane metalloprotease [Ruminococcus sp.]|nr:CPBP family intramembrane metalloprotease [Ruminococcus sp.]